MVATSSVRLVLPSEVRYIDLVHAASEKMAEAAGLDADAALNVGLAVREAVINAIVHGNKMDPTRKVEVSLQARPRSIQARVRDQGAGFDAGSTPDPTVGDNVLRSSGRGLLVMRAFVDSVDFKFREGRGMEVTLKKTRAGRSTTSSTRPSAAAADNGGSER